jgi:hypothetical protein
MRRTAVRIGRRRLFHRRVGGAVWRLLHRRAPRRRRFLRRPSGFLYGRFLLGIPRRFFHRWIRALSDPHDLFLLRLAVS